MPDASSPDRFHLSAADAKRVRARVIEVADEARKHYNLAGMAMYLRLDLRGRCAGTAQLLRKERKGIIRLNPEAFHLDAKHLLRDTVPHEIAHLVAHWTRLGRHHDRGWRTIARSLGASGDRCHTLNLTPTRRTVRHRYRASCGTEVMLGPRQHEAVQAGRRGYRAKATGGMIERAGYLGSVMAGPGLR